MFKRKFLSLALSLTPLAQPSFANTGPTTCILKDIAGHHLVYQLSPFTPGVLIEMAFHCDDTTVTHAWGNKPQWLMRLNQDGTTELFSQNDPGWRLVTTLGVNSTYPAMLFKGDNVKAAGECLVNGINQ